MPGPPELAKVDRPELELPQQTRLRFGADMFNWSDLKAPLRGTLTGKLEYLVQNEGRKPAFLGRYIKNAKAPTAVARAAEIKFIRDQGIAFLPIYAGILRSEAGLGDRQGRAAGKRAATDVITLADKIPGDVFVYANIEPEWTLTKDWVIGWCEGYGASGREGFGGLYCGSDHLSANGPVAEAMSDLQGGSVQSMQMFMTHHVTRPAVWLTAVATGSRRNAAFLPRPSSAIGEVDLWQYACAVVGSGLASDSWGYDLDLASDYAFDHMWAPG